MAAVLCKGIGELCSGLGKAVGEVICLPCKACGCACSTMSEVLLSPFFPYLAVTFGLNLTGVYYGIKSLPLDCPDLTNWLIANAVFCVMHMIGAWYIVHRIRQSNSEHDAPANNNKSSTEAPTTSFVNFTIPRGDEHGAANSCSRIKYVLCHDKGMAVYIIGFIVWMVWLSIGIGRRLNAEEGADCEDEIHYMNVAIGCGYMYLSLVFVAFGCSLCCLR